MNEKKCRLIVRGRSGEVCEICSRARATEVHHRKNRSQGGQWTPANCLHLCSEHHRHVTTHPQAAREQGWAVPSWRDPVDVPVWVARRGYVLLNDTGTYEELEAA